MNYARFLLSFGLLAAQTALAANFTVQVANFSFSPANLSIGKGDSVVWTNVGGTHTSTSGSSCTSDGLWNSGTLSSPGSFSRTFATTGTFPYYCMFHCSIGMTGSLTVTNTAATPPSVSIANPVSGARFRAPATVVLQATASDSGGSVTNVQFFSGGTLLGQVATAPFNFTNRNLVAGNYSFTAEAFAGGLSTTSAVVAVFVETNAILSAPMRRTNGLFQFTVNGIAGQTYALEASSNFTAWIALATNLAPANVFIFTDSNASGIPYRVYRARQGL